MTIDKLIRSEWDEQTMKILSDHVMNNPACGRVRVSTIVCWFSLFSLNNVSVPLILRMHFILC